MLCSLWLPRGRPSGSGARREGSFGAAHVPRIDGTGTAVGGEEHRGFLLLARLTYSRRREQPAYDWRVEFVLPLTDIAAGVLHVQDEGRQPAFPVEALCD